MQDLSRYIYRTGWRRADSRGLPILVLDMSNYWDEMSMKVHHVISLSIRILVHS